MLKKLFLLISLLWAISSTAQIMDPVHWTISEKLTSSQTLQITATATIDEGWHIYDQNLPENGPVSTKFVIEEKKNIKKVGAVTSNIKPIEKYEEMFGMDLRWFEKKVSFSQEIQLNDASDYTIKGYVEFMACNDNTCLPPSKVPFSFEKHESGSSSKITRGRDIKPITTREEEDTTSSASTPFSFEEITPSNSEMNNNAWQPVITELNSYGKEQGDDSNHLWSIFLIGLLGGLLAIATPCVWPIIPMTVSFFLRKRDGSGKRSALLYGLSIIVIYVGFGLLITLIFGANALNALSTNAIFNLFLFVLLVFFAISFFGGFDLTLPASWSTSTENKADSTKGILSILMMAFTLVIVSFSCTGPIIGTLLVHISTQGSFLAPTIGMLGFAIALAGPFTLFALFPNIMKKVPHSGGWMNTVKVMLGFFELAFALKFLSVADLAYKWHILDREVFLVLWIVIALFAGLYILGKLKFAHDEAEDAYEPEQGNSSAVTKPVSVPRLFGSMILFAFALYLVPGLWGAPLKAISAFAPPMWTQDFNLYNETQASFTDYDEAIQYAKQHDKPLLLDFSGYGCVNCRKMEASVWNDAQVKYIMDNDYVLVSLFVDDKEKLEVPMEVEENGKTITLKTIGEKWSYLQRSKFGSNAQPFYVEIDNKGMPLNHSYAFSEDVDAFVEFLKTGLKNNKK